MSNLSDKRENYTKAILKKEDLSLDPTIQFERWYQEAEKTNIKEPNAMTLATSTANGSPSARMVLLKGFGPKGFVFYTNYTSRKGQELADNPQVAAVFWWKELERQVRIEGTAEKVSEDTSISYFHSRPRASQLSAWASPQSQEIKETYLDLKRAEVTERFEGEDPLPLPHFWGGFIIKPSIIEFWQGRESRYHDRYRYSLSDNEQWIISRLAP